jgi:5-methyltetrahydropteroyltriglutamate--homocysteine methyltransferase
VRRQVEAGVSVVNDGEVGKVSFSGYLSDRLSGFGTVEVSEPYRNDRGRGESQSFPEYYSSRGAYELHQRRAACVGPIEWKDFGAVVTDIRNVKDAANQSTPVELFLSATSPGDSLRKTINLHYKTDEEYLQAVADALKLEYEAIVAAGIVLQVDCPDFTVGKPAGDRGVRRSLEDFRKELARSVEALNYATRDIPPEMMRIHVCLGHSEAPHSASEEPSLRDLIDLFLSVRPAGLGLVGANGSRAHEWQVWQDVRLPEGKVVIPGVVDSTTNIIEHPDTVAERIVRYAGVLGRENVIAGVDCGFQSIVDTNNVDPMIAWAKLEALAEGARRATRELWKS